MKKYEVIVEEAKAEELEQAVADVSAGKFGVLEE